jgi:tetratricopeptide (TPR) repeat protein
MQLRRACAGLLILLLPASSRSLAAVKSPSWLEVRSPHFLVVCSAGEKPAQRVARQFELFRFVFREILPQFRRDPPTPVNVLALRDQKSFRELLPEIWGKKGPAHPAGYFARGPEKSYVALDLSATGSGPFRSIYHEYIHLLTRANLRKVPTWLDEGLAEFFSHSDVNEKDETLGLADESLPKLLREKTLLPLEALFEVDSSSQYYNEADRTTVFYAEAWTLIHFLVLGDEARHRKSLQDYVASLQAGVEEGVARRRAFGDLKAFEREWMGYLRVNRLPTARMKGAGELRGLEMRARDLSPGDWAAMRGDFLLHSGQLAQAAEALREALRLDANSLSASESLGFLLFNQGEQKQAGDWFSRAMQHGSRSPLASAYYVLLTGEEQRNAEALETAEKNLRQAAETQSNQAPVYAALASLGLERGRDLEAALGWAGQAVELDPDVPRYDVLRANILLRLGRPAEALRIGQHLLATAKTPSDRATAQSLIDTAKQSQEAVASSRRKAEPATARRGEAGRAGGKPGASSSRLAKAPAKPGAPPREKRQSAVGTVAGVACSAPAVMDLTLKMPRRTLVFHSANYFKVEFLTLKWKPPDPFHPCEHIKGLASRVVYVPVQGQPFAGELISVELLAK